METWTVQPGRVGEVSLRVPGDKSISHRAAMLLGIARGRARVEGFLCSEDCLHTLAAMEALGAQVARSGSSVDIVGVAGALQQPTAPIDLGNSGTGMRLLTGLVAGHAMEVCLTGDASLCSRPMRRISDPLVAMGAHVDLEGEGGCAPVRVRGGDLRGIDYTLPVASAQVKSCVLLAGLRGQGPTRVIEPRPTRDHTEQLLRYLGVPVEVNDLTITLAARSGGWTPEARDLAIPGDFSSAAFWLVAAAATEGARLTVLNVGLNPRRTALLDVLARMGATVTRTIESDDGEPVGSVQVVGKRLRGTEIGGNEIPNLIDELPVVAVAGALAEGVTVIRDAAELRVKESDRLATMAQNLMAVGIDVEERPDGMSVRGGRIRGGVTLPSFGDHRIAMSMAIAGVFADAPLVIEDVACVATSYPGFIHDLERVQQHA